MQSTQFEPLHFRAEIFAPFEQERTRYMARNNAQVEVKAGFFVGFSLLYIATVVHGPARKWPKGKPLTVLGKAPR